MTPAVNPYSESLAKSMAASVEATGWMTVAGPKISEPKMSMWGVTSVSTTGLMTVPFGPPIAPSPVSRLAPLAAASLTSFETRCAPRVLISGPTIVVGSAGSPTVSALTRSTYLEMKAPAWLLWMMTRFG